ncbi:MAG: VWA domain-containing protein [Pyrinomonadaceae bacterium]|nr:VWA domain-containing protein [Chloracidobacterium sp.]MBP7416769.1 VWA domain-containing protein [Pyrinomonadaceae bacterium]
MSLSKAIFLVTFVLFGIISVAAQDDDPIRVDSSIVRLNVGVVDLRGRPILSLNKDSFDLFEDGVKQQITRFEPSEAPFSVVIMLDMSGSTIGFRQVIKQSAVRFIDALSPNDRVAVIEFYDKINLRNDFTTDHGIIANSIAVANGRGKTQLYKALDFALDKLSKEKSRRKAIIVLTDGVDSDVQNIDRKSLESLKDDQIPTAIKPETSDILNRVLNRSDAQGVTIYPLALPTGDPARLADPTPRQIAMFKASRSRLKLVADRSGGQLNSISRLEEMGRLYAQVAADLRTLYTVEYDSSNDKRDGKWRAITIAVKNSDYISRTRQGYFAK